MFQSISSRLRHTFFFENFHEREAQNAREQSKPDASVLVRLIVSKLKKKNHSQLTYCSLEIVDAVKDCDSCGRAILSVPLSLLGSLSLSVCPAIKAYISVTMSWILIKLGESVGT